VPESTRGRDVIATSMPNWAQLSLPSGESQPARLMGAASRSTSRSNKAGFNKWSDANACRDRARSLGAPTGMTRSVGSSAGKGFLDEVQCFKCHQFGHIARDCPEVDQVNAKGAVMNGKGRENGKGDAWGQWKPNVRREPTKLGNFVGRVKSFNSQNGYGFIECPTLKDQGYHDVFVHHTNWQEHLTTGSPVRFDVHLGGKGHPQASNLQLDDSQPAAPQSSSESTAKPDVELGSFLGVIKSFSQETGYGFISCAALRAQGQEKDAFLHHLQIQNLKVAKLVGCGVRFEAYLDRKGRLKAKSLTVVECSKPLCVGIVAVTRESVEAIGLGYIDLGSGAAVEVLYVGSEATDDEDWVYVKDTHSGEQGWMPCSAITDHDDKANSSSSSASIDESPAPSAADAVAEDGPDKVPSHPAQPAEAAQPEVISEAVEPEVVSEAAEPEVVAEVLSEPAQPEGADKCAGKASEAAESSVERTGRPRRTPEQAAAAAAALASELESSESDTERPPPPARPCPPPAWPCPEAEATAAATEPPAHAPRAAEEKAEDEKPKEEKPKEDELAVLAAATPLRSRTSQSSLEHALAVAEELGLELMGGGSFPWNYELIDKERRSFAGHLPGALDEKCATRWLRNIMDNMDEVGGWDRPMGSLGRISRGTKWMVRYGCRCPYRYGGMTVDPVIFPSWMHELMQVCMPMCGLTAPESWPNSCNLNCYADGSDSLDWHADDEWIFDGRERDCRIISLSLGAERSFELRLSDDAAADASGAECMEHRLRLRSGDLLTMEGLTQRHYVHRVPKAGGKMVRLRVNLTWRWVIPSAIK